MAFAWDHDPLPYSSSLQLSEAICVKAFRFTIDGVRPYDATAAPAHFI